MNSQINTDQIPKINELTFENLPLVFKKKSIVSRLIFSLLFGSVLTTAWIIKGDNFYIDMLYGFMMILLVINVIYPIKSYYYKSYAVRENDIVYKSGIFFRKIVVVPFNRIQHVEMKEGPIDRIYNLSKLVFFTAGGSSSDLEIHGLTKEDAKKIRQYTIDKIGVLIEE